MWWWKASKCIEKGPKRGNTGGKNIGKTHTHIHTHTHTHTHTERERERERERETSLGSLQATIWKAVLAVGWAGAGRLCQETQVLSLCLQPSSWPRALGALWWRGMGEGGR